MSELHVILGTGPVGRAVAESLIARGFRVRLVSRSVRMPEPPEGAEVLAADATDRPALDAAVKGAAGIYQCAQPPYGRWVEEFPAFQRAVLEAAERAGARLVLAENLYGYGDPKGMPIRDDSPLAAKDAKGRTRAAMSEEAFAAQAAGRLRVAAARASDFFGPWAWEQSHLGARALGPLARGRAASVLGSPDVPHTFTYIRDFGEALALLGTTEQGDGRAWLVPNDRPRQTQREALSSAAELLGRDLRLTATGRTALTLASPFLPVVRELLPLLYQFEKPYVVESDSFRSRFGLEPTPFDRALAETVDWMRKRGLAD